MFVSAGVQSQLKIKDKGDTSTIIVPIYRVGNSGEGRVQLFPREAFSHNWQNQQKLWKGVTVTSNLSPLPQ